MSVYDAAFVNSELSKPTSIFGLRLWVVIGILVGSLIVITLFLLSICITSRHRTKHKSNSSAKPATTTIAAAIDVQTPVISKEIQEIFHHHPQPEIHVEIGKPEHRVVVFSDRASSGESRGTMMSGGDTTSFGSGNVGPEVSHLGWGRWYTLRELEAATNGLSPENVIGEGGYGIVYSGILGDGTRVAVKNLLNNRGQAEKEFKVEVEAIGRVRHKNLVRLLGYCVEGAYRMLVYEYVDNGNLDQWLHGDVGEISPLTWEIRMNILLGTAKGLAYLHEGLEPKVVHRDVKSSNILIDRQWNAKVSDFGLAKLLCSDTSYVTTRVNLVDWLKAMVGNRQSEQVVDPKLPEMPASKALKRVLLVALRCVDPDATKRPKMGHVIHMLEADDLLFRDDRRTGKDNFQSNHDYQQENRVGPKIGDKQLGGETSDAKSEGDSGRIHHQPTRWR
ncbi:Serine/threonine protein kinase [Parasponia andersonii]|uniref:non-specific serine/threonine protein kinase n=1 Tax=Parasponia andersonii TaxID=3476 RepID=A0A2P5D435_PARAD|nr:Serine/threonine protein kinase [Parasponia andersonii]